MRQFVAVAEELHFGKAARRLNMAQPPLSQAIRRLEVDLGVELFDRSRRAVELTDAGRVFLEEAKRTLEQAELARKLTQRAAEKVTEIRVGFIGPALYRTLPGMLVKYREAFPHVEVRLLEGTSLVQIDRMLKGDLDIGFVTALTEHISGLETMVVERTSSMAAIPASWDLAQKASVRLAELAARPFILPPQKYEPHFSETLAMFKGVGAAPRVTQESSQMNTTISLVGAGLGCSIMTSSAALTAARNVKFLPIEDAEPRRRWELAMIWSADHLNEHAADFVGLAKDYLATHPELLNPDLDKPT